MSFSRISVVASLSFLAGIGVYTGFIQSSAKAFEGPRVSMATLPNVHIYNICSNTSPTNFFTNNNTSTLIITDVWMAASTSYYAHGRLYLDGSPLVRMVAPENDIRMLQTKTGIAIESGQTLSCDRLSSYSIELTLVGYYAHTP